jgi:hypothetical protein
VQTGREKKELVGCSEVVVIRCSSSAAAQNGTDTASISDTVLSDLLQHCVACTRSFHQK